MLVDRWTKHYRLCVGNFDCPDDPRGRAFSVNVDLGVPTGEFEDSCFHRLAKYGSWGAGITLWRWGISFTVRGPIIGSYPAEEE